MPSQKPNCNLSLQVVPLNCSDAYDKVDEAIAVIKNAGVKHEVQPFATIMEGPLDELLAIVLKAKEAVFAHGADELLLNIQIHLKKDQSVSFEEKTAKHR